MTDPFTSRESIIDKHWSEYLDFINRVNVAMWKAYKRVVGRDDPIYGPLKWYPSPDDFWQWYAENKTEEN